MNRDQAIVMVDRLVNLTTGWNDATATALVEAIMLWRDAECARAAIDHVANTWAEKSRPPLGWIVRAYNEALDDKRRRMTPSLHDSGPYPTLEEGYAFAAQGYERDCRLTGKEPNWEYFNRMMGAIAKRERPA
jgi:hypothetical protein